MSETERPLVERANPGQPGDAKSQGLRGSAGLPKLGETIHMRGMNMLQMLGGVVVAGAVAAGATAFTGSGLTNGLGLTTHPYLVGGSITQSVQGATLSSVTFRRMAAPDESRIDQITLVLTPEDVTAGATAITAVTPKVVGVAANGAVAAGVFDTCVLTTASLVTTAVCAVPTAPISYYTQITSLSVLVS